jgi:uncharacterized membrane protein YcaP (DUF421 family)
VTESPLWFLSVIAARTAIILIFLIAALRLLGKRQTGGMNVFDLVLILAIANAVQNAMTEGSGRLAVGLVSAGTLLFLGRVLGLMFLRRPSVEARLVGSPTILVSNGRLDEAALQREAVTQDELLAALRQYGLADLSDVKLAVLEVDGTLSVIPKERSDPAKAT